MVGTTISHYRLTGKIGEGGMGVVYRAEDTKLGRTVALKFVRGELLESSQHRERFVREAQASAGLDHPNICTIHEIDEADGQTFIAMAFVDGQTVSQKIADRPLKLDDALDIAIQTAEGLQAAHARGVVHRDIKSANLIVTAAGTVKIMDFGLARLADRSSLTHTATILGTPAYMSPEQAQGLSGDARSDLWAVGVVLYEMVTGRLPFPAEREAAVLHGILHREHEPITALRAGVPVELDRIVAKALAKRADQRYQHAGDLLIDLRQLRGRLETGTQAPWLSNPLPQPQPIGRERIAWGTLAAALLMLSGWLATREKSQPAPVVRAVISVTSAERLRAQPGDDGLPQGRPSRTSIAISPDGRLVAFSGIRGGQQQVYLRPLDTLEAIPVAGTEGALCPFFSPDGQWVAFWAAGALKKVPVAGGPPITVTDVPTPIMSASWGHGDAIVFSGPSGGVWRVPARGGKPESITKLDPERREISHRFPQLLPDRDVVLFTVTHDSIPNWDRTRIVAQRLDTGARTQLIEGGSDGRYVATGHLVYVRHGTLMAAPFDADRLEVIGGSVGMVAGVMQAANMGFAAFDSGAGQFSVAESGSLVYVAGGMMRDREFSMVWVDRVTGDVTPLPAPARYYLGPRLSPDEQRIAVAIFSGDIARRNVWIHDIARASLAPLTTAGDAGMPVWTTDGSRVIFPSGGTFSGSLFWMPANGTANPEKLTTARTGQLASSIARDGKTLAFTESDDVWVMRLDGVQQPTAVLHSPYFEGFPDFSPDGRWLAYISTETGQPEVWVQSYPSGEIKRQVSRQGGQSPVWRKDGRELFYHTPHLWPPPESEPVRMMAVPVATTTSEITFGAAKELFAGPYFPSGPVRSYDVPRDGRRFLMVRMDRRPLTEVREIALVQNWTTELSRKVPAR